MNLNINKDISKDINMNIEEKQNKFLQTNIGRAVNEGLDIGLKYILPDFVEEDIIEIKDTLFNKGFSEALNKTINKVIELGKTVVGVFKGDIKEINEVKEIIKKGDLKEKLSNLVDNALEKAKNNKYIGENISEIIKQGKNFLLDNVQEKVNTNLNNQIKSINKLENNIEK